MDHVPAGVVNHMMKSKKQTQRGKKGVKVVYISSPMKVKTSASEFRHLVQELTGRDSDTARFMEVNGGADENSPNFHDHNQHLKAIKEFQVSKFPLSNSNSFELPMYSSSESLFIPFSEILQQDGLRSFD